MSYWPLSESITHLAFKMGLLQLVIVAVVLTHSAGVRAGKRKVKIVPRSKTSSSTDEVTSWPRFRGHVQCPLQVERRKALLLCAYTFPALQQETKGMKRTKGKSKGKPHKHWSSCPKCQALVSVPRGKKIALHGAWKQCPNPHASPWEPWVPVGVEFLWRLLSSWPEVSENTGIQGCMVSKTTLPYLDSKPVCTIQ